MIPASGTVTPADGGYTVTIPAYSFTVLSGIGVESDPTDTEAPTDVSTEPADTSVPSDSTPADSTPAETDTTSEGTSDSEPADKKGCGSTLTVTGGILSSALAAAWVALFKRKDN
jgi:hypothetical protein